MIGDKKDIKYAFSGNLAKVLLKALRSGGSGETGGDELLFPTRYHIMLPLKLSKQGKGPLGLTEQDCLILSQAILEIKILGTSPYLRTI